MTKARDLANIISGGFTDADIPNLPASKITSGTFADARIAASNVSQHAQSYIEWQSVQTANFTAVAGKGYPINTTGGPITVTFPASASSGDTIKLMDYARKFATNALTINTNSLKFQGNTSPNPIYNTIGQSITCTYIDTTQGWIPTVDDEVTLETPQNYNADLLVVAGGGSGGSSGNGGGGGAGGYRTASSVNFDGGTTYTITVGDGGAGTVENPGQDGSDSSISGSGLTTITSTGGGGGGKATSHQGRSGGSGGGGGNGTAGGAGNTPSTSPSQGNNGGTGYNGAPGWGGGGGGGASAVGQTPNSTQGGGNGGDGTANSITGSSITYAGGGGGGFDGGSAGVGGAGGGGTAVQSGNAAPATANLGGGGGASENNGTSGSGGKGVVIISIPDANYSGNTTGNPTVTTGVSGKTIIKFTATGSYTA